jgi:hypothetical protein
MRCIPSLSHLDVQTDSAMRRSSPSQTFVKRASFSQALVETMSTPSGPRTTCWMNVAPSLLITGRVYMHTSQFGNLIFTYTLLHSP